VLFHGKIKIKDFKNVLTAKKLQTLLSVVSCENKNLLKIFTPEPLPSVAHPKKYCSVW